MIELHNVKRRRFLGIVATGCIGGCISPANSAPDTASPSETNTSTPDPSTSMPTTSGQCTPEYDRVGNDYGEITDELEGMVLTQSTATVQQGEGITFSLTNETDERKSTGNRSKYDIQHRIDGKWRSIFWWAPEPTPGIHDDGVYQPPGEGFSWSFTMNQEGLSHEIQNGTGRRTVCSSIQPGSYRFVYHGVGGLRGENQETVLGTQFNVSST